LNPRFQALVNDDAVADVEALLSTLPAAECNMLVNYSSGSGSTALFSVGWNGSCAMGALLIRYGAKVNWLNTRQNKPISLAIERDHVQLVELLLREGTVLPKNATQIIRQRSKKVISEEIDALVDAAAERRGDELKAKALAAGALRRSVLLGDVAAVKKLASDPAQRALVHDVDGDGRTALFDACRLGKLKLAQALVDMRVDVDRRDKSHRSVGLGLSSHARFISWSLPTNHYFSCIATITNHFLYACRRRSTRQIAPYNHTPAIVNNSLA
jgi:hypothetical protein